MTNLVLVTSVVNTPNVGLSYSWTRSVYSREERFNQTKETIASVKRYFGCQCDILLVECSDLTDEEESYFKSHCDFVLNLWNKTYLHNDIFGLSKALGEGTMTIEALDYILNGFDKYDNYFKISGRYSLNDRFNLDAFNNDKIVCKLNENTTEIITVLFKVPRRFLVKWRDFLRASDSRMRDCVAYERLIGEFVHRAGAGAGAGGEVVYVDHLGCEGLVSVSFSGKGYF